MQLTTVWQQGSANIENPHNFGIIQQWFASLNGKEITWRQRLIPPTANVSEIDWQPQRFDEMFIISNPEIRGITLYWRKPDSQQERSITPHKLELDTPHQQLYIYPQSQKEVVIRVGVPEVIYQQIEVKNPELEYSKNNDDNHIMILRDSNQLLEVKVTLSQASIELLKQQIL
jgi:hypothetical protein